jgi:CRISPR-associated endonuclease/helicase Cas3
MAWLVDEASPVTAPITYGDETDETRKFARDWFRPARRALLAEQGVGTVDQVLMAALNVRFGFLRLLGLSAKTLVIDEVHAYDEYMTTIMKRLLEWCRALRVNVILLSATLSRRQKWELCEAYAGRERRIEIENLMTRWPAAESPYPLLTSVPRHGLADAVSVDSACSRLRDIAIRLHPGFLEDHRQTAQLAIDSISDGGCVCILANTVKAAQAIFEMLQIASRENVLADVELLLFHARFPAFRRNEIEARVTELFGKNMGSRRPRRAILVATQVVEQSLDVDFDVMISQIAPVDLLLQRSGRLWRHDRDPSERHGIEGPVLHVLTPKCGEFDFGPSEKVYDREILLRTLSILDQRTSFHLPAAFRELIEGCYSGEEVLHTLIPQEELQRAAEKRQFKQKQAQAAARTHLLPIPSCDEFNPSGYIADEGMSGAQSYFTAQTRLGDDTISVLLIDDDQLLEIARTSLNEKSKRPHRNQLKQLFLRKVGLPRWWLMSTPKNSKTLKCSQESNGYTPFFEGGDWLRHQIVLPMKCGVSGHCSEWRGKDAQGHEFVIRNDIFIGVTRSLMSPEREVFDGQNEEEADAGQLG